MTLEEIITRLQDVYGSTLSSSDAYYTRIVNDGYFKICALSEWWWLEKDYIVTAHAPATTIVASATFTATAMHLSVAIPTSYKINTWIEAPTRMYRVNSLSGSADTTFLIDQPWVDSSTTAVSINVWGDTFTLPADFDTPVAMTHRGDDNYKPLVQVDITDIEAYGMNIFDRATEVADRYCVYANPDDSATSKTYIMRIFPPPDEKTEYLLRYRMCPTTLSASTDVPFIPTRYHNVLVDMAKVELFKNEGEDSDRVQFAESEAAKGIAMLLRQNSQRGKINRKFGRRGLMPGVSVSRVTFVNTESGI